MMTEEPELAVRLTACADSGLPNASSRLTMMTDDAVPPAATLVGLATTDDSIADVVAALKATNAVSVMVTALVASVAV